ncbi:ArsJ-associated glyceraldehyde-3-phosphate dehydrogenase [Shewanella sp. 202IG2-18]|uniref:ArsJ-associated glyceraldehyde-3-phosphate dehydrogenase n=1 Tax=Parashewanella hymeniacidonis TaxID=2807618 RepID=UPI0019610523|nr:ArsJ-associated glyceraldehyde-3-phosphate dehydrogenase [Parashewanella hymeniacidonis]MBM7071460.1 ArsJ-associated glyceraldehyde-3-phosphate dehydrogenase [Parashewanella hymeniacidonis]
MTIRVGINGFGRMGRLVLRSAWQWENIEFVQLNDPQGNAETFAHLMQFDSVHGIWNETVTAENNCILVNDKSMRFTQNTAIAETDWSECDVVIEASGVMKDKQKLQAYLDQGVKRVLVTAPVKQEGVLNVVMGVNHHLYNPDEHRIVTAASCTTNCLAPVVKVLHESIGIEHGSMTTIHDITNTQTILDAPHKDLRRARACGMSLIPTTTGSATAITHIFPELKGKLNGHAIRVPLANASITDCVFEMKRPVTAEEINQLLTDAADGELAGVLGVETRPLVSIDYKTDPRSAIVDAMSTMIINDTQAKLYVWYDNEWGYANRTAELARMIGEMDK